MKVEKVDEIPERPGGRPTWRELLRSLKQGEVIAVSDDKLTTPTLYSSAHAARRSSPAEFADITIAQRKGKLYIKREEKK